MGNISKIVFAILTLFFLSRPDDMNGQEVLGGKEVVKSEQENNFKNQLLKLCSDQVRLTRNLMLCIVDSMPGEVQATSLLLENQEAIGAVLIPFCSIETSDTVTEMLYANVNFSIEVFRASKIDSVTTKSALKRWHQNSEQLSAFMIKIFTKAAAKELKAAFTSYVDLTYDQLQKHINGDFEGDKLAYDKAQIKVQAFSNLLSLGIVKQFPEKFSSGQDGSVSR